MTDTINFEPYLSRWDLVPDGNPIITHSSRLLPVSSGDRKAMLKIATVVEEKVGARLMTWWNGNGAARVIQCDDDAILLEWAPGERSLSAMVEQGDDDAATNIICKTVTELHKPRSAPTPNLTSLNEWFGPLLAASDNHILARCAVAARQLLTDPRDVVPLHGDIHHGNILDFGERGWLAIDPKGLLGERGFDYANLFRNPDLHIALSPGRLARQVRLVADAARLDRVRLLHWILAWAGLSATWLIEDGKVEEIGATLQVAQIAMREIGREAP